MQSNFTNTNQKKNISNKGGAPGVPVLDSPLRFLYIDIFGKI